MVLGYWHRPVADKVIDTVWLHTGDLVVRSNEVVPRITGRLKDMIRRAGENVAAAEVEAVLLQDPDIVAVAVVGVPDAICGEEDKAFVQSGQHGRCPRRCMHPLLNASPTSRSLYTSSWSTRCCR